LAEPVANLLELHHPNPVQYNTFQNPEAVTIKESEASLPVAREKAGSRISLSLKPHSLTCLELKAKKA